MQPGFSDVPVRPLFRDFRPERDDRTPRFPIDTNFGPGSDVAVSNGDPDFYEAKTFPPMTARFFKNPQVPLSGFSKV